MSKKDILRGGVDALFNGGAPSVEAPKNSTNEKEEKTTAPEAQTEDIINTIEDEALKAALHNKRMEKRGRPRKGSNFTSVEETYGRVTTIVNKDKMELLREIAFRETLTIKEVLEAAMDVAIERYESKHGKIKITPNREKGKPTDLFK